jgi:hypothetical protein
MASVGQQHAVPAPIQKRRSNAIAIVDPTTNKAIDVLAAKTATEATAATPVPRAASTITIEAPPEVHISTQDPNAGPHKPDTLENWTFSVKSVFTYKQSR